MRIRGIKFWERRILLNLPLHPHNKKEEANIEIAEYFTNIKNKNNNNTKIKVA